MSTPCIHSEIDKRLPSTDQECSRFTIPCLHFNIFITFPHRALQLVTMLFSRTMKSILNCLIGSSFLSPLNLKVSTLVTRAHQKAFSLKQLQEQPTTREDSTTDRPKNKKVAAEGQKRHQDRAILPSASWMQPHKLGFHVWAQPPSAHFRALCSQEGHVFPGQGAHTTGFL